MKKYPRVVRDEEKEIDMTKRSAYFICVDMLVLENGQHEAYEVQILVNLEQFTCSLRA